MEIENARKIIGDSTNMTAVEALAFTEAIELLAEARRLLKLAVDDITVILSYVYSDEEMCCEECPDEFGFYAMKRKLDRTVNHACNKWRYADEVEKFLQKTDINDKEN